MLNLDIGDVPGEVIVYLRSISWSHFSLAGNQYLKMNIDDLIISHTTEKISVSYVITSGNGELPCQNNAVQMLEAPTPATNTEAHLGQMA